MHVGHCAINKKKTFFLLKNILLDIDGNAKLCDFGLARNMGMGTHVLTSVKVIHPVYLKMNLISNKC